MLNTMILTQGSCIGRLISSSNDEMGRWSYHTYSCKNFSRLTIASVYQPCNQRVLDCGHVRTLTVTAQHTSLLRQQGSHKTPRQAFITDLHQFITDQHAQGNGVLLAETTMRSSTSHMTESPNCAPTSTSSTSCFTSQDATTLPPMPTVPNASTIFYATSGCLMLQYKDAMNLFNIASKGVIALWSLTLTIIDYLAILPLHSRHRPSESFHPKMQILTGNTYKQSTNITPNITSHHVSLTYNKHGTPT